PLALNSRPRCQKQYWLNASSCQQLTASATANACSLSPWKPPDGKMIGRSPFILLIFVSLSACRYPGTFSTVKDVKFSKSGTTRQQLDADWSACRKENTVAMSFEEVEPKRDTSFAEEYLINGCMAAKGYTVAWQSKI